MRLGLVILPVIVAGLFGCKQAVRDAHATEPVHSAPKPPVSHGPPAAKIVESPEYADAARYLVPFAWEVSKDEPLAKARSYLAEMLADNAVHARRGAAYFAPLAKRQSPRATVVTCADSRVQADAWDSTAENDDFTVRNLGNQLKNAQGSVQYGLETLHTPVLLILGHTGCGAVKAALGKRDELTEPIRAELESMKLPEATKDTDEKKAWAQGVVANVNLQVGFALTKFGALVARGDVTVIGAVYDLTNDLGRGHGVVSIVNVNGNTESGRLKAFESAVRDAPSKLSANARSEAEAEAVARVEQLGNPRPSGHTHGAGLSVDLVTPEPPNKWLLRGAGTLAGGPRQPYASGHEGPDHATGWSSEP